MITETKPTFAFLLRETVETDSWKSVAEPTLRIKATVVMLVDGKVRNPLDGYQWQEDVADLEVSAHLDASSVRDETRVARLFSMPPEYRAPYSVNLRRAQAMVRTLKRIAAREDKLNSSFGWPDSFGQRLARIADSLGISTFLLWQNPPTDGSYDSGVYDIRDAAGAIAWIDRREQSFRDSVKQPA